jgi:replicative DNA helicase
VANVVSFAEQIRRASRLRQLQQLAGEFTEQTADERADPEALAGWLDSKLNSFATGRTPDALSLGELTAQALAEIESHADAPARPGVMTGLHVVDEVMGPIMPGEVATVAARTGVGKTALAMQVALHNAEHGRRVLFVSLEMRGTELARRVLATRGEVDGRYLRSGRINDSERERLRAAQPEIAQLPVRLWAPPKATLADIRAQARHAKATGGIGLVIVDYIGFVRPSADEQRRPRYEQVSAVSAGFKSLAKELSVPVLSVAQLNREADGEEPRLSHLRESGAIEQDSDIVLLLHQPIAKAPGESSDVYLIVAKHRHGQVGRVRLTWHPVRTQFTSPMSF